MIASNASADLTGVHAAFLELAALRAVDDAGLARYVAGEPAEARHVMALPRSDGSVRYRTLWRNEAAAWCDGFACAAGQPDLIPSVAALPMPTLLTIAAAAIRIQSSASTGGASMTVQGVHHLIATGQLYPLYGRKDTGEGLERYLFADQVKVIVAHRRGLTATSKAQISRWQRAEEAAQAQWLTVRRRLPAPIRTGMVDVDIRPLPSPDPLPLHQDARPTARSLDGLVTGLMAAHNRGWLRYLYPAEDGRSFVVAVDQPAGERQRSLPQARVLAWLLGVADWHEHPELVAYRPDLG